MSVRILFATAATAVLAVAGCSSSGSGDGGGSSQPAGGSNTVTISVENGRLTAPDGNTLYYNTVDTAKNIQCTDGCTREWPPLTGRPHAGPGIHDGDLATAARPDGTTQVTFFGHPLYEFDEDGPGDTKGQGVQDGGGHWVVATPGQAASGGGNSSTPAAPSSSGNGGY